ncbi:hypothetical protein J2787_000312 [Chryseobacterium rhizosphaerae]|uniref:DUF3667 domain-containing protein n=1 Tax=Chryseobacterium rhizosphaerae TaxID=395937 RepID=A0AAE4C1N9_9FLAO|nr:DUF3667 domain-containing protein [Chryseobacterium rhizosphaerae]MDR6524942.1 hypothetical protein [Chryseobacterium rhizosphaerae]
MQNTCLNCSQAVTTVYCGSCGQKTSTHRYSLKHFIEHDFIHGVWHVDKGLLFTVKELFTRPGHSVREYIQGKRVNYFSFITLLVLAITFSALISHYSHINFGDLVPESSKSTMNSFQKFTSAYPKIVMLITIPITSFFSYIWFRKASFNYSEHLVLNCYKMAAEMIAGMVFTLITLFFDNSKTLTYLYLLATYLVSLTYGTWFYFQFFSQSGYSRVSILFRSLMIPFTFMFFVMVIGYLSGAIAAALH